MRKYASQGDFKTQSRHHQKSKTGVSVAPQKGVVSEYVFKKLGWVVPRKMFQSKFMSSQIWCYLISLRQETSVKHPAPTVYQKWMPKIVSLPWPFELSSWTSDSKVLIPPPHQKWQLGRFGTLKSSWTSVFKESLNPPPSPKWKVGSFSEICRGTLHRLDETWKRITLAI